METIFRQGNIEIKRKAAGGRCDYGHKLAAGKYLVERSGVLEAVLGPTCKKSVIDAAEQGTIDELLGPITLTGRMAQARVSRVRQYDRYPAQPADRRDIVEAVLNMSKDEYLHVSNDIEIVPDVANFRKKGMFVYVPLPRTAEEVDAQRLTPEKAAMGVIADLPLAVYAGLKWMAKQDRTTRIFSLVSTIQGKRMQYLLQSNAVDAKLAMEDYGPEVVFTVSSFSTDEKVYKGRVGKLPVSRERAYSQAFELTARCTCEDNIYSTLPRSDMNSYGKDYVNRAVRIGKHETAVLGMLAETKPDLVVDPQPLNPSNELMQLQWRLANRVVHGARMLTGIEQEILLWGAVNDRYLGTERAFGYKAA